MSDFQLWFSTGIEHILDINGYDHILYIIVLSILFNLNHLKKLVLLVTAFTLGHSLTLALSTLDIVKIDQALVELCIALTIIISCLLNLKDFKKSTLNWQSRYAIALIFGCIHGLGFSYLLKSMLSREDNLLFPLLSFNLGLEAGQLIILAAVLIANVILQKYLPDYQKFFTSTITFVILLLSIYMFVNRLLTFF
jgi:large-conductance mechanosensitive channel